MNSALIGPAPRIAVDYVGRGPLLVFLHGIGGNRSNWSDQLPVFGAHFLAAAWDARGYGDSDDYQGPLEFGDFSRDLARVIDHFGASTAHLVGLSMGGRIARDFYFRFPGHVATLTLCNTSAGFGTLSPEAVEAFVRARQEPLLSGKSPRDIAPGLARGLIGKSAVPGAYERLVASMESLRAESYLKTVAASVAQDRGADLEAIRVPVHVVTSDEDRLYPMDTARAMAARIPGATISVIPGAGHLSNLEQPERFNRAVLDFLIERRGSV